MLLEFTVENFRSFRDPTTFSMMASSDKSLPCNLSSDPSLKDDRVLNSAVIYGANASGKTNLVLAITILRNFVIQSHNHQKGTGLNHQPFAFDDACTKEPTRFSISFVHKQVMYEYSMSYDHHKIVEEELSHYPNGKVATIFSRHGNEFKFNRDKTEQEVISRRTLENQLYLSTSVQFNYAATTPAFDWFQKHLVTIDNTDSPRMTEDAIEFMNHNKKTKALMVKAMQIADLGITGIDGKVRKVPMASLYGTMPPQILGVMTVLGNEAKQTDLRFTHKVKGGGGTEVEKQLPYIFESEGTRKLFNIIGPMIDILQRGGTLVVDELDTKLHHDISEWLVSLFHDPSQNKKNAQLIFNTHDQLFLDLDSLRRDQIWFVDRSPENGISDLVSLVEFRERKDRDVMKAYQSGRYGGIPAIIPAKVV
ncbi:MAG TPA: AAA family ATPase [Methanomassiliicoccales archaeon]|nr:AAA family ATPase [Methanomassiliicoccales archaeon]